MTHSYSGVLETGLTDDEPQVAVYGVTCLGTDTQYLKVCRYGYTVPTYLCRVMDNVMHNCDEWLWLRVGLYATYCMARISSSSLGGHSAIFPTTLPSATPTGRRSFSTSNSSPAQGVSMCTLCTRSMIRSVALDALPGAGPHADSLPGPVVRIAPARSLRFTYHSNYFFLFNADIRNPFIRCCRGIEAAE